MTLKTALVVDDSKLARITLQRLLEKHDLSVTTAESGIQALDMLGNQVPDVIFMDHLMPELDGFETTQKIKANPSISHTPVIMCSGKEGVDNYEEQAIAIGACGILPKPPQPERLAEVLEIADKAREAALSTAAAAPAAGGVAEEALQAIIERLTALENRPLELPSFDGFSESLRTLQATVNELTNQPPPQPVAIEQPELDEEALSARVTQDVENILRPMMVDELKALEERVMSGLDEALSESKAEIDNHLANLEIPQAPSVAAPEIDIDSIVSRVVAQMPATDSGPALDEEALQGRLNALKDSWLGEVRQMLGAELDGRLNDSRNALRSEFQGELSERLEALDIPAPTDGGASIEAMEALEQRLEARLQALSANDDSGISEESLINTVMAAVGDQLAAQQQEIDALKSQLVARSDAEAGESIPGAEVADATDREGNFSMVALAALILAAVALAKAFQLF